MRLTHSHPTQRVTGILLLLSVIVSALGFSATTAAQPPQIPPIAANSLEVSATKAPIVPNGTTAGAPTDLVITFINPDPDVRGIRLKEGATVEIELDEAFENLGEGMSIVLLQGWPQSPPAPPPAFPWVATVDGNTITNTLTDDFTPGMIGPGPKQAHLLPADFSNPGFANPSDPGVYTYTLRINPNPAGNRVLQSTGFIRIFPNVRPSVEAVSICSNVSPGPPPFFNPLYQTVAPGDAARQVALYLWDFDGTPLDGVDLVSTVDPSYYELRNGAGMVGEVFIQAPEGAVDYSLDSVGLPSIGPCPGTVPPSTVVPAFLSGISVGLLGVQFTADPLATGDYEISIVTFGGNEKTLFVTAE